MSDSPEKSTEVVINVSGLMKVFRDFWNRPKARAVDGINLQVGQGEVFGILGPNGSGKSTTVKMLLGLLYPTAGVISVFGRDPRDTAIKRRMGYLPEESYLYKYLTAEETLDFYGALFNLPKPERRRRTEQLLEMVGLAHARRRPIGEFSKGMARRIGLAQAMINDPDLLILDEPTSGLDPIGCREMKNLISLLKSRGKTVVVCSHLLGDVEDICDRVVIMYGGKIRAEGTLGELLTVSDVNTITVPALASEEMKKALASLRELLHGEEFKVDHPKKSLEEFFLDVIEKAKAESVSTSGVLSGGKVAEYLSGDASGKEKLLADLVQANKDERNPEGETGTGDEANDISNDAKQKLDSLAESKNKRSDQDDEKGQEEREAEKAKANERLKHLVGK